MEIKKFNVNGKEVEFVNQCRGTRTGFAHDSTMFVDGHQYGKATCSYINRTWERYDYHTSMQKAVRKQIDNHISYLTRRFKDDHNYSKITADRRKELDALIASDEEIAFFNSLMDELK